MSPVSVTNWSIGDGKRGSTTSSPSSRPGSGPRCGTHWPGLCLVWVTSVLLCWLPAGWKLLRVRYCWYWPLEPGYQPISAQRLVRSAFCVVSGWMVHVAWPGSKTTRLPSMKTAVRQCRNGLNMASIIDSPSL